MPELPYVGLLGEPVGRDHLHHGLVLGPELLHRALEVLGLTVHLVVIGSQAHSISTVSAWIKN